MAKVICEFPSSSANRTYKVSLKDDGTLSCSCPGWRFKKDGQERGCKHTKMIIESKIDVTLPFRPIFLKFEYGYNEEPLPFFCLVYPNCDSCSLRFRCHSAVVPEFMAVELDEANVVDVADKIWAYIDDGGGSKYNVDSGRWEYGYVMSDVKKLTINSATLPKGRWVWKLKQEGWSFIDRVDNGNFHDV